ncbi:FmdB family transcriptional regulator [Nakamurella flava]|uniref:FmdB family transcriptional regulator n=1 Tax=Nakamurella flava TaxID=2576308 RepID=A0A4U6QMF5_9ACTN|nr:FmdB family zinc ribbon protein [Nakamurella flava]TKV61810.1 FmdB family transcriptional regulator [Nakamurella flava]
MPTYQYACTDCDHRFEAVQSFSDASLTTCPECSGQLRKVYGSVGVVFKGSGFYRTDSRSGGKGTSSTTAEKPAEKKSGDAKSDSGSSSSAASKPAATSGSSTGGSGSSSSSSASSS